MTTPDDNQSTSGQSRSTVGLGGWIDPNDKTQRQFLPWIGEACLFAHKGVTYYGQHTGGSFQSGRGVTARHFTTWECLWMPLPKPPRLDKAE